MKRLVLIVPSIFIFFCPGLSQVKENTDQQILFRGVVMDASTLAPVSNSQILINKTFSSVSGADGSFSFYVNRNDTVVFRSLGYKRTVLPVSDTINGMEYITGIYMNTDTLIIPEVVILPAYTNLKSDILNAKSKTSVSMENARYNVAVSAYQGKNSQNILGDPQDNYALITRRQKISAFEKGGIPSEQMVGLNAFILIPAAYLLVHGLPENPGSLQPHLTQSELDQLNDKYLETHSQLKK